MNLKFQAKYLPILAPFAAKHDIRYYLNGIYVQPYGDGVLLAACDGSTLAMVYDAEGKADRPVILRVSPSFLRACKTPPREQFGRHVNIRPHFVVADIMPGTAQEGTDTHHSQPDMFQLVLNFGADMQPGKTELFIQAGGAEIDGKYPDVARVVPKRENLKPGAPHAYQLRYLKRLPELRKNGGHGTPVRFYSIPGEGTTLVCEVVGMPEFMAMIVPMHDDRSNWVGGTLPAWWKSPDDEAAAKVWLASYMVGAAA